MQIIKLKSKIAIIAIDKTFVVTVDSSSLIISLYDTHSPNKMLITNVSISIKKKFVPNIPVYVKKKTTINAIDVNIPIVFASK